MFDRGAVLVLAAVALGGCAANPANPFLSQRDVFNNPYAEPVFDERMIGPDCEQGRTSTEGCWIDGLLYPGRGNFAFDRQGNRVRLTRNERRFLKERLERVQAYRDALRSFETGEPLSPDSPAFPKRDPAKEPASSPGSAPPPAPAPAQRPPALASPNQTTARPN